MMNDDMTKKELSDQEIDKVIGGVYVVRDDDGYVYVCKHCGRRFPASQSAMAYEHELTCGKKSGR